MGRALDHLFLEYEAMTRPTLSQAKAQYVHRYTMEHRPEWARKIAVNGYFYAPQFRTDAEWFAATRFPGESGLHGNCRHCETGKPSWPLGEWLESPFYPSH
ncbi:hypothetical protein UFOVP147_23 [uncultured Caudovirales phage]|uniref:Uncharacterized protein n=1 Tax=uncultured Caudovirales phage TaxID=2100421 RepID=A0A6J7W2Y6_9CAUD|nr:hypothetical protein UFOVP147_23 [uncultured Caudovirales phage]